MGLFYLLIGWCCLDLVGRRISDFWFDCSVVALLPVCVDLVDFVVFAWGWVVFILVVWLSGVDGVLLCIC